MGRDPQCRRSADDPGQAVFAQMGEKLLLAHDRPKHLKDTFPIRGIKGPVGSQQDELDLPLTIHVMARHNLVTEGFQEGQVGSSAMPQRMNTRSCERINGLHTVLLGLPDDGDGNCRLPVESGRRVGTRGS